LGANYFDTANSYGIGKSEAALGTALAGKRARALIATKFGNRVGEGENEMGTSRAHIVEACEASLGDCRPTTSISTRFTGPIA